MLSPANILGYVCLVSLASTGTPLPLSRNTRLRIGSFPAVIVPALTGRGSEVSEPLFLREAPGRAVRRISLRCPTRRPATWNLCPPSASNWLKTTTPRENHRIPLFGLTSMNPTMQ